MWGVESEGGPNQSPKNMWPLHIQDSLQKRGSRMAQASEPGGTARPEVLVADLHPATLLRSSIASQSRDRHLGWRGWVCLGSWASRGVQGGRKQATDWWGAEGGEKLGSASPHLLRREQLWARREVRPLPPLKLSSPILSSLHRLLLAVQLSGDRLGSPRGMDARSGYIGHLLLAHSNWHHPVGAPPGEWEQQLCRKHPL